MRYLKIPKERIGVLIGHNGETKRQIESLSKTRIDVDSEVGEISIDESGTEEPLKPLKTENVITAIGRGFSPEHALRLFNDDMCLLVFDLRDYVGRNPSHIHRLKARIIGRDGKTRQIIEEMTGSNISVYGHTVAMIIDIFKTGTAKTAVEMILNGSKHSTVYRYLERKRSERKSIY